MNRRNSQDAFCMRFLTQNEEKMHFIPHMPAYEGIFLCGLEEKIHKNTLIEARIFNRFAVAFGNKIARTKPLR